MCCCDNYLRRKWHDSYWYVCDCVCIILQAATCAGQPYFAPAVVGGCTLMLLHKVWPFETHCMTLDRFLSNIMSLFYFRVDALLKQSFIQAAELLQ